MKGITVADAILPLLESLTEEDADRLESMTEHFVTQMSLSRTGEDLRDRVLHMREAGMALASVIETSLSAWSYDMVEALSEELASVTPMTPKEVDELVETVARHPSMETTFRRTVLAMTRRMLSE
jgi:hypothetical protein